MPLSITQTIVSTLFQQSDEIADIVTNNNALLRVLRERKKILKQGGGYELRRPVMYNATANGGFFSGYETLDLTVADDATAFVFAIKQVYEPVGISGREKRANRDKEQLIDLIALKIEAATGRLENTVNTSLNGDGTAFAGREFDGLKKGVSTTPSTGTYGGISRVDYTWARNVALSVSGGLTTSNVKENITDANVRITRGMDSADLGICDSTAWRRLHDSLTAIQRINDTTNKALSGFKSKVLNYDGIDFVADGGYGGSAETGTIRLLNTKYWDFTLIRDADFKPVHGRNDMPMPIDQDAHFTFILAEGNLCCSNPALQAVIYPA